MKKIGRYQPCDERDAGECAVFVEMVRLNCQGDHGDVVAPNRQNFGPAATQTVSDMPRKKNT